MKLGLDSQIQYSALLWINLPDPEIGPMFCVADADKKSQNSNPPTSSYPLFKNKVVDKIGRQHHNRNPFM